MLRYVFGYHFIYTGFPCEEHENPANYFLDIIIQCETTPSVFSNETNDSTIGGVNLVASYQQSNQYEATRRKVLFAMEKLKAKETSGLSTMNHSAIYATNVFWQVSLNFLKPLMRNFH